MPYALSAESWRVRRLSGTPPGLCSKCSKPPEKRIRPNPGPPAGYVYFLAHCRGLCRRRPDRALYRAGRRRVRSGPMSVSVMTVMPLSSNREPHHLMSGLSETTEEDPFQKERLIMRSVKELALRAAQQRERRTARRVCGLCGEPVEVMMQWADQSVPICKECKGALEALKHNSGRHCAFDEVTPDQLRSAQELPSSPTSYAQDCESTSLPTERTGLWKRLWG